MKPYILILIIMLSSCSMNHHLTKAVKKGYKVETVTKEVRLTDTLTINGKDSIVERLVKVDCPDPVIETKWRVRFDLKRFKDSLQTVKQMYSDSLKASIKTARIDKAVNKQDEKTNRTVVRQENKRSFWWLWLLIGFAINFILKFILRFYGIIK
jgi:hypothetical protein